MAGTGHLIRRGAQTVRALLVHQRRTFVISVIGAAVFAFAVVGSSFALGRVTDRVIIPRFDDGEVATGTVVSALGLVVVIGVVKVAGILTRRIFAIRTTVGAAAKVRKLVVARLQRVPFDYHQDHPTGDLLSNAGNDVDASTEVLNPLPFATATLTILAVTAVWLLLTDVWMALVGFVLFPSLLVLNAVYQRRVEPSVQLAQARLGVVSAVAHESFEGALVVKAMGAHGIEGARFRQAAADLRDAKLAVATTRASFDAVLDVLPSIGIALLLPIGAWRVEQGAVTVGEIVAFVSLFSILVWPLRLIGFILGEVPRAVAGYDRVRTVLAAPDDPRHAVAPIAARTDAPPRIEVRGVDFSYEADRQVLHGIGFTVQPGTTVAVVGATGSGKSTLMLVLAGLLRPSAGAVAIDGRDLADYGTADLRDEIAMAFQEAFLFGDSIVENVLLGLPGGEDDDRRVLREAAALAGMDEFVDALPDGLDTVVGERGASLSGGQRQRVALARALARRPRLLLLDDATSAVDPTTEARILTALSSHLRGTTTLVVANRPSTIALADEVLYLDEGRVVAHGSHEELQRRHRGYEELVRAYEIDRAERGAST